MRHFLCILIVGLAAALFAVIACLAVACTPTPAPVRMGVTLETSDGGDAGIPDYNRSDWGRWIDADHDCQDTRQEVLIRQSEVPVTFKTDKHCHVVSGKWTDPYTGEVITNASDLDIDHMVPLKEAHDSGGWQWDDAKKLDYFNDLNHKDALIAVSASANRSKGDRGPDEWMPPNKADWCRYLRDWVAIKTDWKLSESCAEAHAVESMLVTNCPAP